MRPMGLMGQMGNSVFGALPIGPIGRISPIFNALQTTLRRKTLRRAIVRHCESRRLVAISIVVFNGTQWHSFAKAHLMATNGKKLSAPGIQHSTRVRMSLNVIQGVARMPLLLRQLCIRSRSRQYSQHSRSNHQPLYMHQRTLVVHKSYDLWHYHKRHANNQQYYTIL